MDAHWMQITPPLHEKARLPRGRIDKRIQEIVSERIRPIIGGTEAANREGDVFPGRTST